MINYHGRSEWDVNSSKRKVLAHHYSLFQTMNALYQHISEYDETPENKVLEELSENEYLEFLTSFADDIKTMAPTIAAMMTKKKDPSISARGRPWKIENLRRSGIFLSDMLIRLGHGELLGDFKVVKYKF
jgi:hypothetical protein